MCCIGSWRNTGEGIPEVSKKFILTTRPTYDILDQVTQQGGRAIQMSRIVKRIVTAALVLGTALGLLAAVRLIRLDQSETVERQIKVDELAEELKPLTEERLDWRERKRAWTKRLDAGVKGDACILISVDNMDTNLYDTVYKMFALYGLKATFSLKGGHALADPESQDKEYIDTEQFKEMLELGWEYAVSAEKSEASSTDDLDEGYEEADGSDEEGEPEELMDGRPYLERLDEAIQGLKDQGLAQPGTVLLDAGEFSDEVMRGLQQRGFTMVSVRNEGKELLIGEAPDEGLFKIDAMTLNESDTTLGILMNEAAENRQSIAICINNVANIARDREFDVTLTRFSSFVNKVSLMEQQNLIRVMTYSEYVQYQEQKEQDAKSLQVRYSKFITKMNARLEEIEKEEKAIVARVMGAD